LKRTDQIPVTSSLGTVVSERVLDVLSLLIILGITFLIEFEKLNKFFNDLFAEKFSAVYTNMEQSMLYLLIFALLMIGLWYFIKDKIKKSSWWQKLQSFLKQLWLGFISITRLKKPGAFWLSTIGIWLFGEFRGVLCNGTYRSSWMASRTCTVGNGRACDVSPCSRRNRSLPFAGVRIAIILWSNQRERTIIRIFITLISDGVDNSGRIGIKYNSTFSQEEVSSPGRLTSIV